MHRRTTEMQLYANPELSTRKHLAFGVMVFIIRKFECVLFTR